MPKVSVIVPTFNRASFLKDAIESILLQDYDDFEIIITDNASDDDTMQVVQSFENQKIKYYVNDKNIGVVNNYNKGLELASGEYICIFSDDDIMRQGNISKKVEVLNNYKDVGLVHSCIRIINEVGQVTSDNHWAGSYFENWYETHSSSTLFAGMEYFKILYYHWNIVSMPSVMVRKSVLDKIGAFNVRTHYFCDWDLWMRMCLISDVYYLDEKLLDYRIHSSNTIGELNSDIKKKELILVKQMLFEKFSLKIHSLGFLEKSIIQEVEYQISHYPLGIPETEKVSLLREIKNKIIKLIS